MTKLRQRMLEDMAVRNLADYTQAAYVQQIIAYAKFFHRTPEELGPEDIRTYQIYLTQTRMLSPFLIEFKNLASMAFKRIPIIRDFL